MMADKDIKVIRIKKEDLPPINSKTQSYNFRYRIVSEDKNRTSHWSSQIELDPNYTYVPGNKSISAVGDVATATWEPVRITKVVGSTTYEIGTESEYDIWVKWDKDDSGDWQYKQRITGNSVSLIKPTTYFINNVNQNQLPNRVTVEVFLKGTPITRQYSYLKGYVIGPHTV